VRVRGVAIAERAADEVEHDLFGQVDVGEAIGIHARANQATMRAAMVDPSDRLADAATDAATDAAADGPPAG